MNNGKCILWHTVCTQNIIVKAAGVLFYYRDEKSGEIKVLLRNFAKYD